MANPGTIPSFDLAELVARTTCLGAFISSKAIHGSLVHIQSRPSVLDFSSLMKVRVASVVESFVLLTHMGVKWPMYLSASAMVNDGVSWDAWLRLLFSAGFELCWSFPLQDARMETICALDSSGVIGGCWFCAILGW
jgi:hypothetical protein